MELTVKWCQQNHFVYFPSSCNTKGLSWMSRRGTSQNV